MHSCTEHTANSPATYPQSSASTYISLVLPPNFAFSTKHFPYYNTTLLFSTSHTRNSSHETLNLPAQASSTLTIPFKTSPLQNYSSFFETYLLHNITLHLSSHNSLAYELPRNFHLGVEKLVKVAAVERFSSESLFTTTGFSHPQRSFIFICTSILKHSNTVLAANQQQSPGTGLHIDCSSCDNVHALDDLFTKDGMCEMLDAKDYHSLDTVFLTIGVYFDRCCNQLSSASTTSISTTY